MKNAFLKKTLSLAIALVLTALYLPPISADDNTPDEGAVLDMVSGDIQTVPVKNLTRVSVTNPEVADIADAQSDKVSVLAKKSGNTVLFLWDDSGKRDVKIRVVAEDLSSVKSQVQKLLDEANITGLALEENLDQGKVVISGSLSKDDKSRLENLVEPYSDNLLNLVQENKSEDLIQVDMQVVEISTTLESQMGIQWGAGVNGTIGSTSNASTNSGSVLLNYNENMPTKGDSFADLFRIGNFQRTTPLEATINALVNEGKAKLISKPRLVVVSGKQASFLVGGEIPINTTTSNTTGSTLTQNTTYTQYGVNMTVTPTIHENKIDVVLNVDIRDIDGSTPITSSSGGGNVAFITRTASTDLLMENKQTIALAGLIKYEDSVQITKVPILGDIPVLGALFRYKNIPNDTNTEMVIILTPTVLTDKKFAENQLVMPTPSVREAWNGIDAKYEHEPLKSDWPIAKMDNQVVETIGPLTAYARMVQEKISKSVSYPQSASGSSLEGTVKLKLKILKNGSLDSEEVMVSSGNDVLDQDALNAAKTAAPYDAFSSGMDKDNLVFTIPIVYNKAIAPEQSSDERVIASY